MVAATAHRSAGAVLVVLFGLVGAFGLAPAAIAAQSVIHAPAMFHASSTNWAGYAISTSAKTVTDVKGSWVVPKIQGTCPTSKNQYSSFWVGIDGYSSSTVEQTGTDSDCQSGSPTYYAWFEFYPNPSHQISTLTISPGDVINAEVKFNLGKFTAKITDVTQGTTFSKTSKVSAQRSSAEWIAEAPSSFSGILPLADFGTVDFGFDYTSVSSTNYATISGTTGTFGSFSGLNSITMVSVSSGATKASTGSVSTDHTSFNVTWKSAGP